MNNSNYIDGKWSPGRGDTLISTNPATNEVNWEGFKASQEEVAEAVAAARTAFLKWGRIPLEERISYLRQYETALRDKKPELVEAISKETGKPLWESAQEVSAMITKVEISINAYNERCPNKKITETLYTHHKPHGVVAVFGPFNFPGHLPNGHIVPALLAGNCVVYKCSEETPLVGQTVLSCMEHFPEGVINLLQGDASTGHFLAVHPKIDGLFFTGSHKVGALLMEAFEHHPDKILALEMGGNNPLVMCDATDLSAAAYVTIQSAYLTAGQRCSCARRLIVLEGKEGDAFLDILTEMASTIQVGPYTSDPEPFMGPLINMNIVERLLNAQATYGTEGGECLVEMKPLTEGLPFLTPGLMDVTKAHHHVDEELFGPFLKVIRVPTFEAAIKEANDTAYGLSASLLSSSHEKFEQFYHEIRAGVINWNHPTTGASSNAPFGGVGKSGNFRPSGYYAADYCSYPVASMEAPHVFLPKQMPPGINARNQL